MNHLTYDLELLEPSGDDLVGQRHFHLRQTQDCPENWDRFAQACGATFRGAYQSAVAWQMRHHLVFFLRRYDIFASDPAAESKIGQFVVGIGWHTRVFSDTLHLLPDYQCEWPTIMQDILDQLGPGRYQYGSDWTTEPCRAYDISRIRRASILRKQDIDVYAVSFSDYSSWSEYYKSISNNVRRNVALAARVGCNTTISSPDRLLVDNWRLLLMKRAMFRRKGLHFALARSFAVLAFRMHYLRTYLFTAKATDTTRVMSIFCGLRFGHHLYYLEGASVDKPGGAAWSLLVAMLRLAFEESRGGGKCILGPDDGSSRNQTAWENLRRQRLHCRATPFATSLVTFSYAAADRPEPVVNTRSTFGQLRLTGPALRR